MPNKHRQLEGCWAACFKRPRGKRLHQDSGSSVPYSGWQSSDTLDIRLDFIKAKGPSAAEAKCTRQTKFWMQSQLLSQDADPGQKTVSLGTVT